MGESGTGRGEREAGWGRAGLAGRASWSSQTLRGAEVEPEKPAFRTAACSAAGSSSPGFPAELRVGLDPRPRPHVGPPGSY